MRTTTNYTDATLYHNRSAFATLATGEIIAPSYPIFALHKGGDETIVFDERKYSSQNQQRLILALNTGIITELDKQVLCLVGTFANVCITTKILSELLVLMGYENERIRASVDKAVYRLFSYGLIDSFHFKALDVDKMCATRILTLTPNGFRLLKTWGVTGFYYNAIDVAGRSVAEHKRNCATAQAVVCWLKHVPSVSFSFRKTIKDYVDKDKNAIVRPSATIVAGNAESSETIYVETVRRTETNAEDLLQKLHRYNLVFSYRGVVPALVIVGEDELHTRELFNYLESHNAKMDSLVYTHDLAMCGDFWSAFYTYEGDKRIQLHIA